MKLNETIPGFPAWPFIEALPGQHEFEVYGNHATFGRYGLARTIVLLISFTYFILSCKIAWDRGSLETFAILFLPYFLIVCMVPFTHLLCMWFFPCKKRVRFTPKAIIIGRKAYEVAPNLAIQFRAIRPALSQETYERDKRALEAGTLKKNAAYDLQFRIVEMIYGARIVPITSLADTSRAEQFAVALQLGYDLASQKSPAPHHQANASGRDLPE